MRKGFISYAHADMMLAEKLIAQIGFLKKRGIVDAWSDKALLPGDSADETIAAKLNEAEIILLFVSPDFLLSFHCYEVELAKALERQRRNEARVIPIILRPTPWELTSFGQLESIPAKNGTPLNQASDRDAAFADVVRKVAQAVEALPQSRSETQPLTEPNPESFPAVSVCTITKRVNPGLERMLELLKAQDFRSFEWIIVDGYYHVRGDRMLEMVERQSPGFPVRYVPPKPSPWAAVRPALCNALNTALIWARGKTIVELDDCCKQMPTDWLQKHVTSNLKGYGLTGTYTTGRSGDPRRDLFPSAVRIGPEHFYSAHRSYPLAKAIDVGGYEEMLDGEQGQSDIVMAFMLAEAGVRFTYDPELAVEFDDRLHSLTQFSPDPKKRRWPREPWISEPKTKLMDDGSPHYANEWLAHRIRQEQWRKPNGNGFELSALREIPPQYDYDVNAVQNALKPLPTAELDWRDDQPIIDVPGGDFLIERVPDRAIVQHTIARAVISATGSHYAVAARSKITRFSPGSKRTETVESESDWKSIALAPLTNRVIASARFARIYSKDFEESLDLPPAEDEVHAVEMSPSEDLLATGGWDGRVQVWELPSGELLSTTRELSGSVTAIAFAGEVRLLVATSAGTVETVDARSGEISRSDVDFSEPITALACSREKSGELYVVGSEDGDIRIVSGGSCRALNHVHRATVSSVHISECGLYCISADLSGTALIWYVPGDLLIQKIELTEPILAANLAVSAERISIIVGSGKLLTWRINPRVKRGLFIPCLEAVVAERQRIRPR